MRIQSAADLFNLLSTGSLAEQVAVLRSIADDPRRPLALGKHEGEDFIDLLLRLIPQTTGGIKQLQLLCLSSYQDPRTAGFMADEFARSRDSAAVLHLGKRLSLEQGPDFFRPFLWQDQAGQALAAARFLCGCPELAPEDRLRVAIFLDQDFEPPALDPDSLDLWLSELSGPHRRRVRRLAEQRGEEALLLWERWAELADEEREWLVKLTAPALARSRLAPRLTVDSPYPLVRLAVELGIDLPGSLLDSPDARVRAAAVAQGLAADRLEGFLGASLPEALAATRLCSVPRLLELLGDERWQVRAAASETLATRSPDVEEIRRRVSSRVPGERLAAIETLRRLGDEEWLRRAMRSPRSSGE